MGPSAVERRADRILTARGLLSNPLFCCARRALDATAPLRNRNLPGVLNAVDQFGVEATYRLCTQFLLRE
jgi:hypothetical protein